MKKFDTSRLEESHNIPIIEHSQCLFSENSAFLGIHDALKAFKWTRSVVISLDTSTRFRTAQEEPHHVDGIASLINQSVNITSEVVQLNQEVVTLYLDITSTITFTSRKSGRPQNKKKWFNLDCRAVKRVANGADRNADRNPHSLFLWGQHFLKKKEYGAIRKSKKGKFLSDLIAKVNDAGEVNWAALKQIPKRQKDEEPFDVYDLLLFYNFFNNLYNRKCSKDHHPGPQELPKANVHHAQHIKLVEGLNFEFKLSEINESVFWR